MPRNKDKTQLDRFKEAAKQVEADTSADALDKVFGSLDLKRKPDDETEKKG